LITESVDFVKGVLLSHNIPKQNKLAEKISQKTPEYMLNYSFELILTYVYIHGNNKWYAPVIYSYD
jgi:hypothetical protein